MIFFYIEEISEFRNLSMYNIFGILVFDVIKIFCVYMIYVMKKLE